MNASQVLGVAFGLMSLALVVGMWLEREPKPRRSAVEVEQDIALARIRLRVAATREQHAKDEARRAAFQAERAARWQAERDSHTTLHVCPVDGCPCYEVSYLGRDSYRLPVKCSKHHTILIDTGIKKANLPCT